MERTTKLRLGRFLGTGPELWLNLQKRSELRLAEEQSGPEIRRTVAAWSVGSEHGSIGVAP